jgi:hypothetical protein
VEYAIRPRIALRCAVADQETDMDVDMDVDVDAGVMWVWVWICTPLLYGAVLRCSALHGSALHGIVWRGWDKMRG